MADVQTQTIHVDADHPDDQLLRPAAEAIRNGELVAFPTETVYGLGANALDPNAVARIFSAKGRPGDNPLIVHIASLADLPPLVREIPPLAIKLFKAFSPGPLTLILPKSSRVPDQVTAGLDTVAVRIPAHPVALRLIELAGVPIAAPSANRSGRPSPTQAWHVAADLSGRIPYIIEAGNSKFGLESTVVDVTGSEPVILRPGAITANAIRAVAGSVAGQGAGQIADNDRAPRSPGMKYRHYAPKAQVLIAEANSEDERYRRAAALLEGCLRDNIQAGIFGCRRLMAALPSTLSYRVEDVTSRRYEPDKAGIIPEGAMPAIIYGERPDAGTAAAGLFDALRRLDRLGVTVIIAEGLPETGIGAAYMNRLRKAAGANRPDNAAPSVDCSSGGPI